MSGRRLLAWAGAFLAGAAAGFSAGSAPSQSPPRMWAEVLLQRATDEIPRKVELHVRHDRWEPGAETGRHQHPGPAILYILEGELLEETRDGTVTLKPGQAVWRAARQEHNVRNRTGTLARALAIHLDPAQ